jgi:O-methyltransferase
MSIAAISRKLINRILRPFELKLSRYSEIPTPFDGYSWLLTKHRVLLEEFHSCMTELVFPELPSSERRIELMMRLVGTPVSEAFYLLSYLHRSMHLPGDVCEFGIAQGATSALLANEIRMTGKNIWLFDSFKGLGKPTEQDKLINDIFSLGSIEKYEGTMSAKVEEVHERLATISFPLSRAKVVAGFIEDTIGHSALPSAVCFAYIDFDFYRPISIALNFLAEHLSVGGFVIVDDYGFFSSGAKTAVDEFTHLHRSTFKALFPYKFAAQTTPFCILQKIA